MPPYHTDRLIDVVWNSDIAKKYNADIEIIAFDSRGIMQNITNVLSNEKINIINLASKVNKTNNIAKINMTLEIDSLAELTRALEKINQIPNIQEVKRLN